MKRSVIRDIIIFAMLGTIMFISKLIMEFLPNIHAVAMFIAVFTLVYRWRALIPIYVYVFLVGLVNGFNLWWYPYIYIWTILWGVTMLLPQNMTRKVAVVVYPVVCALHGFAYGTLYAPAQALFFGLNFEQTVAWIVAGLGFDVIHGVSNFAVGFLILPFSELLHKLSRGRGFSNR